MSKNRKWLFLMIEIMLVSMFVAALFLSKRDTHDTGYRMIMIPKVEDMSSDFWRSLIDGAKMAAEEYNVEIEVMAPVSEEDFEAQKKLVHEAIDMNPEAILLAPSSYTALTDVAKMVKEAGIKLVLIDSFLDQSIEDVAISTDNYQAGSKMGEFVKGRIDKNSRIGIVSHVQGSSTAIQREAGLRDSLGEFEKNIVSTVFCDSDYDKAYKLTEEMLRENPDINVIFGLNEYSAVGAARAVRDLGLKGKIQMVGFDSSIEEIQLLEAGIFSAIVIQKPFSMGYLGVEKAVKLMWGESIPVKVDSGSELITKENMYSDESQKLLFPFWGK